MFFDLTFSTIKDQAQVSARSLKVKIELRIKKQVNGHISTNKANRAAIAREEQDKYFRDKMGEHKWFLERQPDYYDDGLIVVDQSYSEL